MNSSPPLYTPKVARAAGLMAAPPLQGYCNHAGTLPVTVTAPVFPAPGALSHRLKLPAKPAIPPSLNRCPAGPAAAQPAPLKPGLPVSCTQVAGSALSATLTVPPDNPSPEQMSAGFNTQPLFQYSARKGMGRARSSEPCALLTLARPLRISVVPSVYPDELTAGVSLSVARRASVSRAVCGVATSYVTFALPTPLAKLAAAMVLFAKP